MWSSTTTTSRSKSGLLGFCLAVIGLTAMASAQSLEVHPLVQAGEPVSISTHGSGTATIYVAGPVLRLKQTVTLGQQVQIAGADLTIAGRYRAVLCTGACQQAEFHVVPAAVERLGFLVHPSRAPVRRPDSISGVVVPFDRSGNLILQPVPIDIRMSIGSAQTMSRQARTLLGVTWFRTNSGERAGAARLLASSGETSALRVVQLVASEPCRLRFTAQARQSVAEVETEVVRDCAGNLVADGTVVTFTGADSHGRSSVDAPVKQGVARARLLTQGAATISAASGVVEGNEVHVDGKP
jgi:hypothetical protein